jgi:hypothetical protein
MPFQTIYDMSLMLVRERVGREASPSGGVLDSQTVKAPHAKWWQLLGVITPHTMRRLCYTR